jgi:hypothetical protein
MDYTLKIKIANKVYNSDSQPGLPRRATLVNNYSLTKYEKKYQKYKCQY